MGTEEVIQLWRKHDYLKSTSSLLDMKTTEH